MKQSIYGRANAFLKYNDHLPKLNDNKKRQLINSFGLPYGLKTLPQTTAQLRKAHAYMVKILWPNYRNNPNFENGFIKHRFLYNEVAGGLESLAEVHRKLRNRYILGARQYGFNQLISTLVGGLGVIDNEEQYPSWLAQVGRNWFSGLV